MSGSSSQQKETAQQKALAEMAKNQQADYQQRWLPVQRKLAESIQSAGMRGSAERTTAKGVASTDSANAFGEAQGAIQAAMASSSGVGSAKSKLAISGLGDDQSTSRGLGYVASDAAIDDAYMQGLSALTALGRGEKAGAISGMQQQAAMSSQKQAADAEMAAKRRAGNMQLAGQAAGFGAAAYMQPGAGAAPAAGGTGLTADYSTLASSSSPYQTTGSFGTSPFGG